MVWIILICAACYGMVWVDPWMYGDVWRSNNLKNHKIVTLTMTCILRQLCSMLLCILLLLIQSHSRPSRPRLTFELTLDVQPGMALCWRQKICKKLERSLSASFCFQEDVSPKTWRRSDAKSSRIWPETPNCGRLSRVVRVCVCVCVCVCMWVCVGCRDER